MTISPNHRLKPGVGWSRGGNTRCRVPEPMSGHGKDGQKKELDKDDSLYIFETTGVFVAVGSGKYSYSS